MKHILLTLLMVLGWTFPAAALQVPNAFVEASWLKANLGAPSLKVIEVSSAVSYDFDGHIPGAALTTKGAWRVDEADGVYVHRPVDEMQQMIRDLGVNAGDAVVIYGKGAEMDDLLGAGYLYWVFHFLGHDNVALLDESWSAWLAEDGAVETDTPTIPPGTFVAHRQDALLLSTDQVLDRYQSGILIDARPATHYAGTDKFPANTKYGRIEGSINQPWPDSIAKDMDGRLYMTSTAPRLVRAGALNKDDEIMITCFGGTGAAMAFVLLHHHGYRNLSVHDAGIRRWNVRNLPLIKD